MFLVLAHLTTKSMMSVLLGRGLLPCQLLSLWAPVGHVQLCRSWQRRWCLLSEHAGMHPAPAGMGCTLGHGLTPGVILGKSWCCSEPSPILSYAQVSLLWNILGVPVTHLVLPGTSPYTHFLLSISGRGCGGHPVGSSLGTHLVLVGTGQHLVSLLQRPR